MSDELAAVFPPPRDSGHRCTNGLRYGAMGDPESADIFEKAQSMAPVGWHIEGQLVPRPSGIRAQATQGCRCTGEETRTATAWGNTAAEAMSNLLAGLWGRS